MVAVLVRVVPGFITRGLGLLLGNVARRIVEDGAASAADVDKAMRLGYGHPMGPLELADLVGLDARRNNLRSMLARSGDPAYAVPSILDQLVEAGRLGKKSGAGFYDYDSDGRAVLDGEVRR
jgi:3-hydroxybutyryl-CoA dehydrogenase